MRQMVEEVLSCGVASTFARIKASLRARPLMQPALEGATQRRWLIYGHELTC
ncbi:MAG: hypothetical protein JWM61_83 [Micrococcaceae bacterium]|jgi:hypothetical protein|nr:hypothetical protein [Micrococcaceae bacterium]